MCTVFAVDLIMRLSPLLLALVACTQSTPQKPTPRTSRGLHADEHRDAAREHERRAEELTRYPETRRNDVGRFDDPNSGLWYRAWDQAEDHRHLASIHASEASRLHAEYDEACANIAPDRTRLSPIQRYGAGGMPTETGVVVFLTPEAGPPDRLLAELRCHRAWMMMSEGGMETCPLDLPGLSLKAHGDAEGISIEIQIKDRTLVPELQRRAARDLELATKQHATR